MTAIVNIKYIINGVAITVIAATPAEASSLYIYLPLASDAGSIFCAAASSSSSSSNSIYCLFNCYASWTPSYIFSAFFCCYWTVALVRF